MSVTLQNPRETDFTAQQSQLQQQQQLLKSTIRSYIGQGDSKKIATMMFEDIVKSQSRSYVEKYPQKQKRIHSTVQALLYPHLLEVFVNKISTLFIREVKGPTQGLIKAAEYSIVAYTDGGVGFPVFARSTTHFDSGSKILKSLHESFGAILTKKENLQSIKQDLEVLSTECMSDPLVQQRINEAVNSSQ